MKCLCYVIAASLVAFSSPSTSKMPGLVPASAGTASKANAPVEQLENTEMRAMFESDQAIRQEMRKRGGWQAIKDDQAFLKRWASEDARRLKRTKELLAAGVLQTGIDFHRAAFIFQHSDKAEDYLKAHHLAVISIAKGFDARWISAATLDRYLQAIGKQQIYGTQYRVNEAGQRARQPVEAGVISDAERMLLGVPAIGEEK